MITFSCRCAQIGKWAIILHAFNNCKNCSVQRLNFQFGLIGLYQLHAIISYSNNINTTNNINSNLTHRPRCNVSLTLDNNKRPDGPLCDSYAFAVRTHGLG